MQLLPRESLKVLFKPIHVRTYNYQQIVQRKVSIKQDFNLLFSWLSSPATFTNHTMSKQTDKEPTLPLKLSLNFAY